MKKTKKILALFLTVGMLCGISACNSEKKEETTTAQTTANTSQTVADTTTTTPDEKAEKTTVKIATLMGPTGMGMAKLMSDDEAGTSANDYEFTVSSAPDDVTAGVISGNFDIAAVPTNLASVLYNKTKGEVQVLALNTLGVLYILENGNTINSVQDLRGKTVYATGQGSTPEYILDYILEKNGIDPEKDVTIVYKTEHAELATLMTAGEVTIGLLPVPNVTSVLASNTDVRIALNLTDEWEKAAGSDSSPAMGCVIVNKKFAEENKAAVDAFLTEYSASIAFVNENSGDASTLMEKYGIIPKAAIALKAIPDANITFISGDEMKTKLTAFLNVLFAANPTSVGGTIPDDEFFYK